MSTQPQNQPDDGLAPELSLPKVIPDAHAVAQPTGQPHPHPSLPNVTQAVNTASQSIVNLPDEAKDTDLIEKEWVEKAKQIVEQMSDDPYQLQQELAKVKADYMKKRYGKDIKLTDS